MTSDEQSFLEALPAALHEWPEHFPAIIPSGKKWKTAHIPYNHRSTGDPQKDAWLYFWKNFEMYGPEGGFAGLRDAVQSLAAQGNRYARLAILELESTAAVEASRILGNGNPAKDKEPIISNHTGYKKGGENFEHDDTGSLMNFSGVEDEMNNALKEHQDWQKDYDY